MKQNGKTLTGTNLQLFLDSAANAAKQGPQQFFTSPKLAEALVTPLQRLERLAALDFNAGSGNLLKAITPGGKQFGIDIDPRSSGRHTWQAYCTLWYPLAAAARLTADFIVLNPPFSLTWHAARLEALRHSTLPAVTESFADFTNKSDYIDSTAASLLIALDLLTQRGEGFMLCNARTARRFLGDPESQALSPVRQHIWAWLEVPSITFENQHTAMDLAVLYFARSHRSTGTPHFLRSPSKDPATIALTLQPLRLDRAFLRHGPEVTAPAFSSHEDTREKWTAVKDEYQRLHHPETQPEWNIWLAPDGTFRRNLTTYQKLTVTREAIKTLDELQHRHPAALVVQQEARIQLQAAVTSGIWRVQPAVVAAVQQAITDYNAVRAPFYPPSPTHALGWIDEERFLTCTRPGIHGIHPGETCTISTWTEETRDPDTRIGLNGEPYDIELVGHQLVVSVTGPRGSVHHFHVSRKKDDDPTTRDENGTEIHHHDARLLVDHFDIPIPPCIAQVRPEEYQHYRSKLQALAATITI